MKGCEVARIIAAVCLIGAAACALYDIAVKHTPLTSWHFDALQGAGWVLMIIGLIAAFKIKPRGW
jgi:hypothetical protein